MASPTSRTRRPRYRLRRWLRTAAPPQHRPGFWNRLHHRVKEAEPWGILLAVIGLGLSLVAFWIDYSDRVEERTVRAWQLLTTKAPGNSGKIAALEYLKERVPLVRIDLSTSTDATQTRASGVYLRGINLEGADLLGAKFGYADLDNANLRGTNLLGADLGFTNMTGVSLRDSNLIGADVTDTFLISADLTRADLALAKLSRSVMSGAILDGAILNAADLSYADLRGARFDRASVKGATFREANIEDADLSGATGLTQSQLDAARCGNARVPDGLTTRTCK